MALFASVCVYSGAQTSAPTNSSARPGEDIFTRIVPNDCRPPSEAELIELRSTIDRFHVAHQQQDEVRALILSGVLYEQEGEYKLALPFLERAARLTKGGSARAEALTLAAVALTALGKPQDAERDAGEAAALAKAAGDAAAQASALRAQAEAVMDTSTEKARQVLSQALPLAEQTEGWKTQALILNDEAEAEADPAIRLQTYQRALGIDERFHDCRDRAATLINLATLERDRGYLRVALDDFDQAQALGHQVGDLTLEAQILHQAGYFHWQLGDLAEALTLFHQSLEMKRHAGDVASQADTLGAIAGVDRDTQWPDAALDAYRQALPMFRRTRNVQWQVWTLNNLGAVEADLHRKPQARIYYGRAVRLAPVAGDRVTPAFSTWGIDELEEADALSSYLHSARMAREYEQPDLEGEVDSSLMAHFRTHNQPNIAIFFGKRAVDQFQSLRRSMNGMSNALTSSFSQRKSATYRELAEILIDRKRWIEAQQVLDLLKMQQYSDYVGAHAGEFSQPLSRSPREAPLEAQFENQLEHLAGADQAFQAARSAKPRAIATARDALRAARAGFDAFVQDLIRQLEAREGPAIAVESVSGAQLPLENLIQSDPHVAALYTLEGADTFRIIAITKARRFSQAFAISQTSLDDKCQHFLKLIKNAGQDPTASAQDLFHIIFAPVQEELRAAGVTTLIWSLDGSLRYIPIAALQDCKTKHYLIDDYAIVNYTPLSRSIADAPQLNGAKALGMGVSGIHLDGLGNLPNVPAELGAIVHDDAIPQSHGVLPGKILLDDQFTQTAMEQHVQSQAVVHIASHFVLLPGSDDLSYLLLGGKDRDQSGYRYSLAEFANSRDLHIGGTKLLTLSACQTGAANERKTCFENRRAAGKGIGNASSVVTAVCDAGNANQRENGVVMEGLSEAAIEKGAEAVISSLWSVDDRSTGELMADFYQRWVGSGGKLGKAEALRQAERDLLHGNSAAEPGSSHRGVIPEEEPSQSIPARYTHPHFWAPFVLTGNWQ